MSYSKLYKITVNGITYQAGQTDTNLVELTGPRPHLAYNDVAHWVDSLQGSMDRVFEVPINDVHMTDEVIEVGTSHPAAVPEKTGKKGKKGKTGKKGKVFDIPKKKSPYQATRWLRHVYDMMLEASVPITEEIIDLFNGLMTYLYTIRGVYTSVPQKYMRYQSGVVIQQIGDTNQPLYGITMYFDSVIPYAERGPINKQIMELYLPLFNKISGIVIPFMKKKHAYESAIREIDLLKKSLIRAHESLVLEEKQHAERMKEYYQRATYIQTKLAAQESIVRENTM